MTAKPLAPVLLALWFATAATPSSGEEKSKKMTIKKMTPVLLAEEIEPCIRFWVERMGFEKTMEVPDGDKLAFAIVQKGDLELMYQTYASVQKDASYKGQYSLKGPTFLYIEVEDLDQAIAAVKGASIVMDVRTTFYGSKEVGIKDPAGHILTFAQMGVAPQK
jgi:uncharacterized glyoxalase superfamily protein PhnB